MPNWKKVIVSGSDASLSSLSLSNLGSQNEILLVGANNQVSSSDLLSIDTINERIGIGTSSPSVKLDLVGETSGEAQVRIAQHDNSTDGPDMRFFKSRGTAASPSAVNDNDYVGAVNAFVYDGSNYQQGGFFGFQAEGADGDTTFGLRTRVGGTLSDRIAVDAAGDVDIAGTVTATTFSGSLLRLDEGGTGLRLTNVGGFEPQSGIFNIFGNNDVTFGAGGSGASHRVLTMYESDKSAHFANNVAVTGSITIDDTDARLVLDRNATSNDAEVVFTTNGTENWSIGTGQVGGDNDFTFRSYGSSNAIRFNQDGHITAQGSITGSSFLSEGDILPDQDNVHSLGSSTRRFQLNGGTPVTVTGSGTANTLTRFQSATTVEDSSIFSSDTLTRISHDNDGNDIFIVSGSNGELIKVTDSVTDTLFQVNDGSGITQFEVSSSGAATISGDIIIDESNQTTRLETQRISVTTTATAIANITVATHLGVLIDYTVYHDNPNEGMRTGQVMAAFESSGQIIISDTSTGDIGDTSAVTFSETNNGTVARITLNTPDTDWNIRTFTRLL